MPHSTASTCYHKLGLSKVIVIFMCVGRVPEGDMTVDRVAELVGRNRHINTIDVSTQVHACPELNKVALYFISG